MTTTPEARIAEAAELHTYNPLTYQCSCDPDGDTMGRKEYAAHLAAVIAALSDIAIVELPESIPRYRDRLTVWPVQMSDRDEQFVRVLPDGRIASDGVSNPAPNANTALLHAVALLAAARAAGGES